MECSCCSDLLIVCRIYSSVRPVENGHASFDMLTYSLTIHREPINYTLEPHYSAAQITARIHHLIDPLNSNQNVSGKLWTKTLNYMQRRIYKRIYVIHFHWKFSDVNEKNKRPKVSGLLFYKLIFTMFHSNKSYQNAIRPKSGAQVKRQLNTTIWKSLFEPISKIK